MTRTGIRQVNLSFYFTSKHSPGIVNWGIEQTGKELMQCDVSQTSCFTKALNNSWQIMTRALPSQIRRSCRCRSCEIHLLSQARWTSDKLPEFQILKQNGISSLKIYFFPSVLRSEELEVFHNCFESFVNVERFEEFWYKGFVQKYKEGSDD